MKRQYREAKGKIPRWAIEARNEIVLAEAGGAMTLEDFCAALIARGWAYPDFTPDVFGRAPDDIIKFASEDAFRRACRRHGIRHDPDDVIDPTSEEAFSRACRLHGIGRA